MTTPLARLVAAIVLAVTATGSARAQRQSFAHHGITRSYVVRAPKELARSGTSLPVVLVLHGGGGNAENAERRLLLRALT